MCDRDEKKGRSGKSNDKFIKDISSLSTDLHTDVLCHFKFCSRLTRCRASVFGKQRKKSCSLKAHAAITYLQYSILFSLNMGQKQFLVSLLSLSLSPLFNFIFVWLTFVAKCTGKFFSSSLFRHFPLKRRFVRLMRIFQCRSCLYLSFLIGFPNKPNPKSTDH